MKFIFSKKEILNILNEQAPQKMDYSVNIFKKDDDVEDFFKRDYEKRKNFTPQNFAKYVKELNILYPDVAIAQSMIESGHFGSDIFKQNNNLFGMKHPGRRKTTSVGKKNGHASYKDWLDSVKDYKLWQENWGLQNLSKEEYLNKLNQIYCIKGSCNTNDYASKVKQLLSKANSLLNYSK
jgi:flagellum-specific peptidoglycan hydrolase FlgJ